MAAANYSATVDQYEFWEELHQRMRDALQSGPGHPRYQTLLVTTVTSRDLNYVTIVIFRAYG